VGQDPFATLPGFDLHVVSSEDFFKRVEVPAVIVHVFDHCAGAYGTGPFPPFARFSSSYISGPCFPILTPRPRLRSIQGLERLPPARFPRAFVLRPAGPSFLNFSLSLDHPRLPRYLLFSPLVFYTFFSPNCWTRSSMIPVRPVSFPFLMFVQKSPRTYRPCNDHLFPGVSSPPAHVDFPPIFSRPLGCREPLHTTSIRGCVTRVVSPAIV